MAKITIDVKVYSRMRAHRDKVIWDLVSVGYSVVDERIGFDTTTIQFTREIPTLDVAPIPASIRNPK